MSATPTRRGMPTYDPTRPDPSEAKPAQRYQSSAHAPTVAVPQPVKLAPPTPRGGRPPSPARRLPPPVVVTPCPCKLLVVQYIS